MRASPGSWTHWVPRPWLDELPNWDSWHLHLMRRMNKISVRKQTAQMIGSSDKNLHVSVSRNHGPPQSNPPIQKNRIAEEESRCMITIAGTLAFYGVGASSVRQLKATAWRSCSTKNRPRIVSQHNLASLHDNETFCHISVSVTNSNGPQSPILVSRKSRQWNVRQISDLSFIPKIRVWHECHQLQLISNKMQSHCFDDD